MTKKKRSDDTEEEKEEDEETTEEKAKDGEEVAINSDILEESLDEPQIADPADDDLDGGGNLHAASLGDDEDDEIPAYDDMG